MPVQFPTDEAVMQHALALARQGEGHVEPNPMVGAVIVDADRRLIAEGYHAKYGGPHAEAAALAAAGSRAAGADLFVTLEPCSHFGKTPPCADAVIAAGIRRVVAATGDPAVHVGGKGFDRLERAGIAVETGLCGAAAERLIRPFRRLMTSGRPYVIGKWAMSLDGRIATRTGASQWISGGASRALVHDRRGRMDAILVGIGTVLADDPQLTARPPGPRTPLRIVVDSRGRLPLDSQLVQTARDVPVLVATTDAAPGDWETRLAEQGVEIIRFPRTGETGHVDLQAVLAELGRRRLTNVLVEGGGSILGSLLDARLLDEVDVYVGPKLLGGSAALSPVLGHGAESVDDIRFEHVEVTPLDTDVRIQALISFD